MITELLRDKILAYGNTAELARKTGVQQQILHRFASGQQKSMRLDKAEQLLNYFGFRVERDDYRSKVTELATTILREGQAIAPSKLSRGLRELHDIFLEHPTVHPTLKNATKGMYQLFNSWEDSIRSIQSGSAKLAKLIHLPVSGKR